MAKKKETIDGNSLGNISGKKLVIVESPTKAKTIRKFLGKDYIVESCMGHIRDLPQSAKDIPEKFKKLAWAKLGVNVENNFEPLYCIPKDKHKVVSNLREKLSEASSLYLATDEDREGESISWHLTEVLKPKVPFKRMVFNEITKEAIEKSLKDTRDIDFNLVKAQEARRILDRLVGYTISPLLWKKVSFGLSAGRVQSVAVKLIVEKEHQRIQFKSAQYCGVLAELKKEGIAFESKLLSKGDKKVALGKDFDGTTGKLIGDRLLLDKSAADKIVQDAKNTPWIVSEVEEKPVNRKPSSPFITSTLQQEANRKLGLSSRETMQVAQKLYEQGFITYMRTDSTFLSKEAIEAARANIAKKYGKEYLPAQPRLYEGKKVKGAQEAHEAIRPAGQNFIDPDDTGLNGLQLKLYELIWMRTMASQMTDARQKQVSAKIQVGDYLFQSNGMTIEFPGYLRAYVEGSDDPDSDLQDREVRLPQLKVKEKLDVSTVTLTEHETKPPARYTEASLVQMMEKEGIGRPSTYASIIGTIIDRGYVKRLQTALAPTFTAMVVSKLLNNYLTQYVDLGFTSEMEKSLDHIAEGDLNAEKYLASVYLGKTGLKELVETQGEKIDPDEARGIKIKGLDNFIFKVGKFGAYLSTKKDGEEISASIPESETPADLTEERAEKLIEQKINGADSLGKDPVTDMPIYALNGRFGPYVQLGDVGDNEKPKRVSIPPNLPLEQVTMKEALQLLSLPKLLGMHPQLNKEIKAGLGRFGPYVVCEGDYRSIPKTESIFDVTFERAMELFSQPKKGRGKAAPLKELGLHPDGQPINIMNGPYGPYFKHGKKNYSLPEGLTVETATLESALQLTGTEVETPKKAKTKPKPKKATDDKPAKKLVAVKPGGLAKKRKAAPATAAKAGKAPVISRLKKSADKQKTS